MPTEKACLIQEPRDPFLGLVKVTLVGTVTSGTRWHEESRKVLPA
jgi:hypothetical protein